MTKTKKSPAKKTAKKPEPVKRAFIIPYSNEFIEAFTIEEAEEIWRKKYPNGKSLDKEIIEKSSPRNIIVKILEENTPVEQTAILVEVIQYLKVEKQKKIAPLVDSVRIKENELNYIQQVLKNVQLSLVDTQEELSAFTCSIKKASEL
jgi:hypothetical protein